MSSQEYSLSHPHADVLERQARQHRTPKHLEDYILAYNPQRPALSSQPDEREHEEQRGAAAAVDGRQADAGLHLGTSRASHSPSSGDPLSTTALRQLIDSMSRSEREERAEIAQLTNKLSQYECRQRHRQELLEHITSFLQEEEEKEDDHRVKGATSPLTQTQSSLCPPTHVHSANHPPPADKQAQDTEHQTGNHTTTSVILTSEGEAKVTNYTSTLGWEREKSAFIPIQPASSNHSSSPYSNISSGMVTLTSAQQHPIKPVPLQSQVTGPYHSGGQLVPRHQPQV